MVWFKRAHAHLRHTAVRGHRHQLWVSVEVKRGSAALVLPTVLPATVEDTFGSLCKNNISHNDIHNFIMIFIHDVYK